MSNLPPLSKYSGLLSAGVFFSVAFVGFSGLGPLIGIGLVKLFFDHVDLMTLLENPTSQTAFKLPYLIIQGSATLFGLIIIPILLLFYYLKQSPLYVVSRSPVRWLSVGLALLIVLCFLPPLSVVVEWNEHIFLPDFMREVELWLRQKEDYLFGITQFLTRFENEKEFLMGMLVIAVLPAIGEELVFRGIVQHELNRFFKNYHLAIWISAFLFSAIHFQFFGFFPRLLLGALFGYMYVVTNNLLIPMVAHFINNGITLTFIYVYQQMGLDLLEGGDLVQATSWPMVIFCCFLLVFFWMKLYQVSTERNG